MVLLVGLTALLVFSVPLDPIDSKSPLIPLKSVGEYVHEG
jgi:hypothetical protein